MGPQGREVALGEAWVILGILVLQTGEGVNDVRKGACASHVSTMANFLKVRPGEACSTGNRPHRLEVSQVPGCKQVGSRTGFGSVLLANALCLPFRA